MERALEEEEASSIGGQSERDDERENNVGFWWYSHSGLTQQCRGDGNNSKRKTKIGIQGNEKQMNILLEILL